MFTVSIDEFMIELKDGAIKNVGGATKSASAKLFDVESVEARAFGDKRVKFEFADGEGNTVEVAVFPPEAKKIGEDVAALVADSAVFE